MKKILLLLVITGCFQWSDAWAQSRTIDLEFSPLIFDQGPSLFTEFKGVKLNVPIYLNDSWSISPYLFLNRRNLNANDTYGKFYNDIAPTVFNFFGLRVNRNFLSDQAVRFRIFGGVNYQVVTEKYFGAKITSRFNPNIGGSVKWVINKSVAIVADWEVIKVVSQHKNDAVWKFIEKGNYIDGEVGDYEFDGHATQSLTVGVVWSLARNEKTE
jgi:hypothetical protein